MKCVLYSIAGPIIISEFKIFINKTPFKYSPIYQQARKNLHLHIHTSPRIPFRQTPKIRCLVSVKLSVLLSVCVSVVCGRLGRSSCFFLLLSIYGSRPTVNLNCLRKSPLTTKHASSGRAAFDPQIEIKITDF